MDKVFREVKIGNEKVKVHEVKIGDTIVRKVKVRWGIGNKIAFVLVTIILVLPGWFVLFSSPLVGIFMIVLGQIFYWRLHKNIKKKSIKYSQIISEMERQKQEETERQRNLMEAENRKKSLQDWDE